MEGSCGTDICLSQASALLLLSLLDSESADAVRKKRQSIVKWIEGLATELVGLKSFSVGDLLSKTSLLLPPSITQLPTLTAQLPSEQVELTLFYDRNESPHCDKWFLCLYEALCNHHTKDKQSHNDRSCEMSNAVVDRISYFPREKILEAVVDGTFVSVRPNNICSLAFSSLLEEIDTSIGCESLLKRSIVLIKAWCLFEAPLIQRSLLDGTENGLAAKNCIQMLRCDKVIEVMVMWLFSSKFLGGSKGPNTDDPLTVLLRFLDVFSSFEWSRWGVSVTGLVPLPTRSPSPGPCDEDTGTEIDSPVTPASPCPSMLSLELDAYPFPVTADSTLSAIVNRHRDRLRLQAGRSVLEKSNNPSNRRHNGETDEEDGSCDTDVIMVLEGKEPSASALKDDSSEPSSRRSKQSCNSAPKLQQLIEPDEKPTALMYGEICILDPTKRWTNLSAGLSHGIKDARGRGDEGQQLAKQESLKALFAAGLQGIRQFVEPSKQKGSERVAEIIAGIFPALSKTISMKDIGVICEDTGAVIAALLQGDVAELDNNLTFAEVTLSPKMSNTAVEDLVFRTVSEKGPQSVKDVEATLRAVPAAAGWFAESESESPRLRNLLKVHSLKLLLDAEDVVRLSVPKVRAVRDDGDAETVSEASSAMLSVLANVTDAHEAHDNLGLSEITISKSFSSFESDQGSDNFINIENMNCDTPMRFSSQYSTPMMSREPSARDPSSAHQASRTINSTVPPGDEDKTVYHQHQKTLQRRTQNLLVGQPIVPSTRPPPVTVSRIVDYASEHNSASSAQSLKGQSPTTLSPSVKPNTPPFIQPFVVKEMQVWVPGKFGSSSTGAATVSKSPLPVANSKPGFKGGYTPMGAGVHTGTGAGITPPVAGRYSPVTTGLSRPPNNSYLYPPLAEEEFDVNWVDQPDEGNSRMRANRIALAGHQQMQGQLGRSQRSSQPDHLMAVQYAGPTNRSPLSDRGSPHSTSPPGPTGPYTSQTKRPPVSNTSAFIAQTNRLNYNGNMSAIGGLKTSSSPLLQSQRELLREGSPPGLGALMMDGDFDNWSLSSQQHATQQLLRQQQYPQQSMLGMGADGSFTSGGRGLGLPDTLSQDQMRGLQQQRMAHMVPDKTRQVPSSQREKSEAQLPSFLRDL